MEQTAGIIWTDKLLLLSNLLVSHHLVDVASFLNLLNFVRMCATIDLFRQCSPSDGSGRH